jgi:hypothetical protein
MCRAEERRDRGNGPKKRHPQKRKKRKKLNKKAFLYKNATKEKNDYVVYGVSTTCVLFF